MSDSIPRFPPNYIRKWKVSQWQAWMWDTEVDEYDEMADRMSEIDEERRALTDRMNRLRNRCIHRRRYQDNKTLKAKGQPQTSTNGG